MQNILETLNRIGPSRLIAIGITLMGLMGFFGFFVDKMMQPEFGALYTDLEPAAAGAVITRLEAMGVKTKVSSDGSAVLAPKGELARLRMILAQDGLPSGGASGYELMDGANGLGVTSFAQQMMKLRALEGELARSIRTLAPVRQARVHLVLPKRELFSREQPIPTASIILAVQGAKLNAQQVDAIQHLVASAVPKLEPDQVSIIDTRGNLLASGGGDTATGGAASGQIEMRKTQVEDRLSKAIESLLARTIGPGRVRAEVSADLDFDRITTNSEEFDPEGQVLRSTQTVTEENQSSNGRGSERVSVDNNLPEADANAAGGNAKQSLSKSERTEEINNFEISKTIRTHVRESGLVRRLSVAVIVDAVESKGEDGAVTYTLRSTEELAVLEALAKSAIGFDAARGDIFEIASLEFIRPETLLGDIPDEVISLTKEDYFRIGQIAALFIIALLAMLLVMRPAINRALGITKLGPGGANNGHDGVGEGAAALPPPDGEMAAIGQDGGSEELAALGDLSSIDGQNDNELNLDGITGSVSPATLTKIGALIDEHPEEAAAVLRTWMQRN